MDIDLKELKEMQEDLFKQQCDLDIQKAMVKHFINKREAAISVTRCCETFYCADDDNGIKYASCNKQCDYCLNKQDEQ